MQKKTRNMALVLAGVAVLLLGRNSRTVKEYFSGRRSAVSESGMQEKTRNVALVLAGVAVLLLRGHYDGWGAPMVRSYGGNFGVSFAVYFMLRQLPAPWGTKRWVTAGLALAAVSLFEATNGFGVTANTYDRWDFVANAAGIGLALGVDAVARVKK